MKIRLPLCFSLISSLFLLTLSCFGQPLEFVLTKTEAFAKAKAEGKLVMADFGREGCSDCDGTTTAMGSSSYRVKQTLLASCVMWKSDIDHSSDYVPYIAGLGSSYALPVLCLIDPLSTAGSFLVRSTALQDPGSIGMTFFSPIKNTLPLVVTNLTGSVITNNAVFTFKGTARTNATLTGAVRGLPITSVMWRLNGTGGFQPATGTTIWSASTTLTPGVNTFESYATYQGTSATSWTNKVTVTYDGPAGIKQSQTINFTQPSTQTYGASAIPLVAVASSGLQVALSVLSGPGTISGTNLTMSGVGTILVKAEQAGNATYDPANPVTNSISVIARPITVSAIATNKVYGASEPAFLHQITSGSLVPGDSITGSLARTPGNGVGNYAILQGTISAGPNYTLTFNTANFSITSRPITVTADAKSKTSDASDPQLTFQITSGSLLSGDAFTGDLYRVPGNTPGNYAIQRGSLTAGTNYALSYIGAYLTITENPPVLTGMGTNQIVPLGSNTTFRVTATGATGYRWMRNGVLLSNGGSVSGATSSILSLANITPVDVGFYECQVYNNSATNKFEAGGLWIAPGNARKYFGVPIFGPTNLSCHLEYRTNVNSPWIPLTNSLIKLQRTGQILVDEDPLEQNQRFYRLVIP